MEHGARSSGRHAQMGNDQKANQSSDPSQADSQPLHLGGQLGVAEQRLKRSHYGDCVEHPAIGLRRRCITITYLIEHLQKKSHPM